MIKLIDKKSVGFFLVGFVVGLLLFFFFKQINTNQTRNNSPKCFCNSHDLVMMASLENETSKSTFYDVISRILKQ